MGEAAQEVQQDLGPSAIGKGALKDDIQRGQGMIRPQTHPLARPGCGGAYEPAGRLRGRAVSLTIRAVANGNPTSQEQ